MFGFGLLFCSCVCFALLVLLFVMVCYFDVLLWFFVVLGNMLYCGCCVESKLLLVGFNWCLLGFLACWIYWCFRSGYLFWYVVVDHVHILLLCWLFILCSST